MAQTAATVSLLSTVLQYRRESSKGFLLLRKMATLPSGLSDSIPDDEDLARFLTQSSQFTTTLVKPAAFLPNPKDHQTSVSRHGPEPRVDLWMLGLSAAGTRTLYAAAIFKAQTVRAAQLEVEADEPPPRHAVITRWPWILRILTCKEQNKKNLH